MLNKGDDNVSENNTIQTIDDENDNISFVLELSFLSIPGHSFIGVTI